MSLPGYGHRFGPNFSRIDTRLEDALPRLDEAVVSMAEEEDDMSLRERVEELEATVAALLASDDEHDESIATAESEIDSLQAADLSFDSRMDIVEDVIENLEGGADLSALISRVNLLSDGVDSYATIAAALADAESWRNYVATNGDLRIDNITTPTGIIIPFVCGGKIIGHGYSEAVEPTNDLAGPSSRIIWSGSRAASETLVTYYGQQMDIEHIGFHGATRTQIDAASVGKCPILFQIVKPQEGLGTGKLRLHSCAFNYGTVGIAISNTLLGSNCDRLTLDKCFFERNDVCIQVNNAQGMGQFIREPHIRNSSIFLDYKGGGDTKIQGGLLANQCTLLNFEPDTGSGFGSNSSEYKVYDLKVDSQAVDSVFLNMSPTEIYFATVKFRDLHLPSSGSVVWSVPSFIPAGQSTLILEDVRNMYPGMIKVLGGVKGNPRVIIRGGRVLETVTDVESLFHGDSTGSVTVTVAPGQNYYNANVSNSFPSSGEYINEVISF